MPRPDPQTIAELLATVSSYAGGYLDRLDTRPVAGAPDLEHLQTVLGGPLPDLGEPPWAVLDRFLGVADGGTVATGSARYFGFVIGGALPAAMALDMLTPVWDQNVGLFVGGPAASVAEEAVRRWLVELFRLPVETSLGFVTGGQMANTTALAIARHHVLAAVGWDVEADGLTGAPPVTVVVGEERHSTIDRALRFIGLGSAPRTVAVDTNGAMDPAALEGVAAEIDGPMIVCAQVGNVNTGALDPVGPIVDVARKHGAWLHVDGAFGLWARCLERFDPDLSRMEEADSWAVDAHKWLNVPYDCGLVFSAHPGSHQAAIGVSAEHVPYLSFDSAMRDGVDWSPEFSRRARGPAVWAALRSLGRSGVVELVERGCAMAVEFADTLAAEPGIEIRNDVVLNQVLVAFADVDTDAVIEAIQRDGTCWMGGTTWRGERLMRISVSNWQTESQDIQRSAEAVIRSYRRVAGRA
jgi:glutamate/tyrosine decarboxylase-like PLP-dependent enzyme